VSNQVDWNACSREGLIQFIGTLESQVRELQADLRRAILRIYELEKVRDSEEASDA